ncbi:MAG: HAMP domain-containing histidine kinase [Ruminococcaceae bacterium]|nr:HAMP domain-containing histidine kinase [Oscillospiraceae bacterium]
MIDRLRRRFIIISIVSVLSVVTLVFGLILSWNIVSLNRNMDILADRVSEGGGRFPGTPNEGPRPDKMPPKNDQSLGFINPETPFSTRHFTVFFDEEGNATDTFTDSIYAITKEQAVEYAQRVLKGADNRGWISSYRYKVFSTERGRGVVFVDGSMNRSALTQSMVIAAVVLFACGALVLILILLLSKRAVKPIAQSYEKQKQFITDANHELKTPLTLILANLDIAEGELGKNEWLEDIRSEGMRMAELVNQLVALSRMDEEEQRPRIAELSLGETVYDTVSEFEPLALSRGKTVTASIDRSLKCRGDESLLRRLVGILMDNAVKYCDKGGEISVSLQGGRCPTLTVENSYSAVDELDTERLFDRFYRADRARTFNGGYGLGLAMARSIVQKHRGEISAYKKDGAIGFKVILHY